MGPAQAATRSGIEWKIQRCRIESNMSAAAGFKNIGCACMENNPNLGRNHHPQCGCLRTSCPTTTDNNTQEGEWVTSSRRGNPHTRGGNKRISEALGDKMLPVLVLDNRWCVT